jgi:hypothetical protein
MKWKSYLIGSNEYLDMKGTEGSKFVMYRMSNLSADNRSLRECVFICMYDVDYNIVEMYRRRNGDSD